MKDKSGLMLNYEVLLMQRDEMLKRASFYQMDYYAIFGAQIQKNYECRIEGILLKKKIEYYQKYINRGKFVDVEEVEERLAMEMELYNNGLEEIKQKISTSQNRVYICSSLVSQIKSVYRDIVKKLHPDRNPEFMEDEKIRELWLHIQDAYNRNDLESLLEYEIIVKDMFEESLDIQNVAERIEKLQLETENIAQTSPYNYKFILEDEKKVEEKKLDFQKEYKILVETRDRYKKRLDDLIQRKVVS